MIVDSISDGGADILLSDPNSEASNLIIGQSKLQQTISYEEALNAMLKMATFYIDMLNGQYESVNTKVQRRFLSLNAEIGEESKICFVLHTSAPKNGIRKDRIESKMREYLSNYNNIEIALLFADDICDEIKESESRRPSVEAGKITIDKPGNCLEYGENAVIVNASAFSIKELYATHNNNLLSRNLRYHIAGRDIDKAISDTITNDPYSFWFKNNGITIICDNFESDGKDVRLKNFSVVNGGQTTYLIHKSKNISKNSDLFLPCKIIMNHGENEEEKSRFSLDIAKATNSQKAIKPIDLKANSPEQVRFSTTMREAGLFYQTKRGEKVPTAYNKDYLNTDLAETGKLCLAAVFQLPATSRSKPSSLFLPKYYEPIFNGNQAQIAHIMKELLYIDYYFRNTFTKKFDAANEASPTAGDLISFAHNARTVCIASVAIIGRYMQQNLTADNIKTVFNNINNESSLSAICYDIFKNINGVDHILPPALFADKDKYEDALYRLFAEIIDSGTNCFSIEKDHDVTLNATNYLKKDVNYYRILKSGWRNLERIASDIFNAQSI